MSASMTSDQATASCDDESAPPTPLEKVRALLADVQTDASDEILALVADLVANNAALQRQLAEIGGKRFRSSEVVSSAQLRLLLKGLVEPEAAEGPAEQAKADDELTTTANLDEYKHERDKKKKRRKHKRPAARPFPAKLRRVDNPIPVPKEQRVCPKCDCERVCVGHDVSEVLDRKPAEIIVRVDRREKLACKTLGCEGSVCQSSRGVIRSFWDLEAKAAVGGVAGEPELECVELLEKGPQRVPLAVGRGGCERDADGRVADAYVSGRGEQVGEDLLGLTWACEQRREHRREVALRIRARDSNDVE